MLKGVASYLDEGGRLMYLGGNGFYWRVAFHEELPGAMEMRRGEAGTRMWTSEPGETGLATTAEPSGMWRHSGYRRSASSVSVSSPKASTAAPSIAACRRAMIRGRISSSRASRKRSSGDFGVFGGAAALELDIVNPKVGTPAHALRLASSEGHSNVYVVAQGEVGANHPGMDGIRIALGARRHGVLRDAERRRRLSTGSIGWAGSLAHDGYDNNISRITRNVLERFIAPEPFAMP